MQHGHAHAMDAMDAMDGWMDGWMDAMPCDSDMLCDSDSDMVSTCDSDILGGDSNILGGINIRQRHLRGHQYATAIS